MRLNDRVMTGADGERIADALAANSSARHLAVGRCEDAKGFPERLFERNGWITELKVAGITRGTEYTDRNYAAHGRARAAVYAFLICTKREEMRWLHKDLKLMIARMVLETAGEVGVWETQESAKSEQSGQMRRTE